MKQLFHSIGCAMVLAGMLLFGASSLRASEAKQDTLHVKVFGQTICCTYQNGATPYDYVIKLVNADSIAQYEDFDSAIAQEIFLNYNQLFGSSDRIRLIMDHPDSPKEPEQPKAEEPEQPKVEEPEQPKVEEPEQPKVEEPKEEAAPSNVLFTFEGCYFDFDKAVIKPQFYEILNHAADVLKMLNQKVFVVGHTDSMGNAAYNQELSIRRAKAVRAYLAKKGVNINLMVVKGYGEKYPKDTNATVAGRAKNRRCEILLKEY